MTTQFEPIRGKVAKILSDREVALNIGQQQGVQVGMLFAITDPIGDNITDPDTGEDLGCVYLPKTQVKVTEVSDKLSVAATYRTKSVAVHEHDPDARTILGTPRIFQPARLESRRETLRVPFRININEGEIHRENCSVSTGDPVVQVVGEM